MLGPLRSETSQRVYDVEGQDTRRVIGHNPVAVLGADCHGPIID